jgi:hypothetical protein
MRHGGAGGMLTAGMLVIVSISFRLCGWILVKLHSVGWSIICGPGKIWSLG